MTARRRNWQILNLLNYTTDYLAEKGFDDARLNAEHLLGHSLSMSRVELYLNYDQPLTPLELGHFKSCLKRRLKNEPLQYIIGETEFMSLSLKVNRSVLIPRPETEILVEKVIETCKSKFGGNNSKILDIGTGSGCIAISLAKYLDQAEVTALDVSKGALQVAEANAQQNHVAERVRFFELDFLNQTFNSSDKFDVIVSNPPYISREDFESLPKEIRFYEPSVALKDGADGLGFFKKMAAACPKLLRRGGFLMVEVGLGQANIVKNSFSACGFGHVQVIQDLNGIERIVFCEL